MSEQAPEVLLYDGQKYDLIVLPLVVYISSLGRRKRRKIPATNPTMTSCIRGYIGTWEISEKKLFLKLIDQDVVSGTTGLMRHLFPNSIGSVFAEWFTGSLICPYGNLVNDVRCYFSEYERYIVLDAENGIIVGKKDLSLAEFKDLNL
jgi:hypothetical protein